MGTRFLFAVFGLLVLTGGAHAQTPGYTGVQAPASRQYSSPLQQNFSAANAPARTNSTSDLTKRCKELAAEYDNAFRPAGTDQANAVVPNYGRYGERDNTTQRYMQRNDAEKAYNDLGCR